MYIPKKAIDAIRYSWYGPERGLDEKIASNPQFHPVSETLDKYLSTVLSDGLCDLEKIRDQWDGIVGTAYRKFCRPVFFRDGKLTVEVNHPAFRLALDTPVMKKIFLERLSNIVGECSEIVFIPPGRFRMENVRKEKV